MTRQDKPKRTSTNRLLFDYLNDIRVLQVIAQLVFIILLVSFLAVIWTNTLAVFDARGIRLDWGFFDFRAGFQITESPDWYDSQASSYGEAFLVGVINTLRVVSLGLVGATVLGVLVGILLLSNNWLIKQISRIYVEVLRNTPLLVQLYFWYFVVFFTLPPFADAISIPQESVSFIPVQYPIYLVLLLVTWLYARRAATPSFVNYGALVGIILFELVTRIAFIGTLTTLITVGLLLLLIFGTRRWRDFASGYLIITIGQAFLAGLLFIFNRLGIVGSPDAIVTEVQPIIFMSLRGVAFPELFATATFAQWMAFVGIGVALATVLWVLMGHVTETTGKPMSRGLWATVSIIGFAAAGWLFVKAQPFDAVVDIEAEGEIITIPYEEALADNLLTYEQQAAFTNDPLIIAPPQKGRFRYDGGTIYSIEYAALLVGLIIYTSAFIAEIVRAGIQAVPYGQIEASRALGLSATQTLAQVVLPQALRVIIPPMGNQYLNLAKNSSLAAAIAFADTYQVGQTVMNQSGQSLVGFTLIFFVYISMSLIISLFMNIVNSRFQLVTR